mgnify:CR=1 FL=1
MGSVEQVAVDQRRLLDVLAYGLQAGLWLDMEGGTGTAWYATGMPGERLGGRSAFSAVEEALARGAGPLSVP